ncbi:MAG: DUF1501 domain-containing protein [Candidatus Binatia bacterium]
MTITRRDFLKTSAAAGLSAFILPRLGVRHAFAAQQAPVLVALYLRGGADGLNLVVPAGDPFYYSSRPTIAVPHGSELALDGFFGLNPMLAPLLPLYATGALAFIHAAGSPDPSRSHFDCQDFMERAAPGNRSIVDGWLARWLAGARGGRAIAGVTLRHTRAKALLGSAPSLAFPSLDVFTLTGNAVAERRAALEARYDDVRVGTAGQLLGDAGTLAFDAMDVLAGVDRATSAIYPTSDLGLALQDAAALIKADIGVRAIAVDLGGWDHHTDTLHRSEDVAPDLALSLAAFHADLGAHATSTLTLAMTEFGRRVAENGTDGTDHGHGGVMLALGGGIAGGRVLLRGAWPGLAPDALFRGQDLPVTTDFRNVFAEALHRHLAVSTTELASILPGFTIDPSAFPGLWS